MRASGFAQACKTMLGARQHIASTELLSGEAFVCLLHDCGVRTHLRHANGECGGDQCRGGSQATSCVACHGCPSGGADMASGAQLRSVHAIFEHAKLPARVPIEAWKNVWDSAQTGAAQEVQQREVLWQAAFLRVASKRPSPALPAWSSVAWRRLEPWRVSFSSATHRSKISDQASDAEPGKDMGRQLAQLLVESVRQKLWA